MVNWRIAAHTADIAIVAEGDSEGAALGAAGLALTSVLTENQEPHTLGSDAEIQFRIEAPDMESLAVAFLAELLWLVESDGRLWTGGGATVTTTDEGLLAADVSGNGVIYDPATHGRGTEVKAVTYHDLQFSRTGSRWNLRVLLDI